MAEKELYSLDNVYCQCWDTCAVTTWMSNVVIVRNRALDTSAVCTFLLSESLCLHWPSNTRDGWR